MGQSIKFPPYITRVETVTSPSSSEPSIVKGLVIAGQNIGRYVTAKGQTSAEAMTKFLALAEAAHKAR